MGSCPDTDIDPNINLITRTSGEDKEKYQLGIVI